MAHFVTLVTEKIPIDETQVRLLTKFKKQLEKHYDVDIDIPIVKDSSSTEKLFTSMYGVERDIRSIERFFLNKENYPNDEDGQNNTCFSEIEVPLHITRISENTCEKNTLQTCTDNIVKRVMVDRKKKLIQKRKDPFNKLLHYLYNAKKPRLQDLPSNFLDVEIHDNYSKEHLDEECSEKQLEVCNKVTNSKQLNKVYSEEQLRPWKIWLSSDFNLKKTSKHTEKHAQFLQKLRNRCKKQNRRNIRYKKKHTHRSHDAGRNKKSSVILKTHRPLTVESHLRPIVIDGSNVARRHGNFCKKFSCMGIKICVDFFVNRGHTEVTAFVPKYLLYSKKVTNRHILTQLAKKQHVVFTPSRIVDGKCVVSYDDRFIIELASINGGVILSNDKYRDVVQESELYKQTVRDRLLNFSFMKGQLKIPNNPLGERGPRLEEFLSFPTDVK